MERQENQQNDKGPYFKTPFRNRNISKVLNQNRLRKWDPQNLVNLQMALDSVLDYFQKHGEDMPKYNTEFSNDIVYFTNAEDNFLIRYLHDKSASLDKLETEHIFREMLESFPSKRTEQELKCRAVQLCQHKYEINQWHAITNRYEDTYIPEDVPEFAEFQRILNRLRYYILPINDPSHPASPTLTQ
ncbi:PREDICTED: uncharacterized protein LOC105361891 [Ceratosolen solmsi marchali]|uniref:Uncharacterized protein LOC105361891 n=1 Tax=Ceratosolen solmsi marchali TaxID=326594 RepID=A0AAJ7DV27_9HYME|nr:PREDICTED: uncharacterized protein LOC105361891 [Ceratosolen solmsi marchali]